MEKLILELLESKKKHQHIVNFFLATKKATQSDVTKLKKVVEAYNSLKSIDEQIASCDNSIKLIESKKVSKNLKLMDHRNENQLKCSICGELFPSNHNQGRDRER